MLEFDKLIREIKALADRGEFDDAIKKCNFLLEKMPEMRNEILRIRAYVYSLQGMHELAIVDRNELIKSGDGTLRDYYLLGDNSLSLGRYADASKWLLELLRLSAEQNEKWFDTAALQLLAYAQMELGQLKEAIFYLDQAIDQDPECAIPLPGQGMANHLQLREEINRRNQKTKKYKF